MRRAAGACLLVALAIAVVAAGLPSSLAAHAHARPARGRSHGALAPSIARRDLATSIEHAFDGRAPIAELGGVQAGPRRVMLVIHGGAWHLVGPRKVRELAPVARRFQRWGWETVNVDYRPGLASLRDVVRFYDAVRGASGPGAEVCAYGDSAGGTLALLLAAHRPTLDCVIAAAAPTDFRSLRDDTPDRRLHARLARLFHGRFAELSPLAHAAEIRVPVLAGYATNDRMVPADQGFDLRAAVPGMVVRLLAPGSHRWVHSHVSAASLGRFVEAQRRFLARIGPGLV